MMKVKEFKFERLNSRTCELYEAEEAYACNKTVFLLQDYMQEDDENVETWTVLHFERDRFGLLNGLICLLQTRGKNLRFFFSGKDYYGIVLEFEDIMDWENISEELDILYT